MWVCFVLYHLAAAQRGYCTPMEALTGQTPDISPLLSFYFWEPVYCIEPTEDVYPSGTKEKMGQFVVISESVGDALMYEILTDDTKKIFYCNAVHSALVPGEHNLHLPLLDDDDDDLNVPQVIHS